MKKRITVTLDAEALEWLKQKALELDRSVSWIVNKLVKREMEERKDES